MNNLKDYKKISIILLAIVFLWGCSTVKKEQKLILNNPNSFKPELSTERGKCYSKCIVDNYNIDFESVIPIYKGNASIQEMDVLLVEIEVKEKGEKWVKRKVDENCSSTNPEDCFIWCLVPTPAEIKEYIILLDTIRTKQFELENIDVKDGQRVNLKKWFQTICLDQDNEKIISMVQTSLKQRGFYKGEITRTLDDNTKLSIIRFQDKSELPIGQLTISTLEKLGVEI